MIAATLHLPTLVTPELTLAVSLYGHLRCTCLSTSKQRDAVVDEALHFHNEERQGDVRPAASNLREARWRQKLS